MPNIRRLPPLLRVARIVGLLFILASFALLVEFIVRRRLSSPPLYLASSPEEPIGLNLIVLGVACSFAVSIYSKRFGRLDRGRVLLSSWQSQVLFIVPLSALPLCGIALALVSPPTSRAFGLVFPITLMAAVVVFLAGFVAFIVGAASTGPMRTPPTG